VCATHYNYLVSNSNLAADEAHSGLAADDRRFVLPRMRSGPLYEPLPLGNVEMSIYHYTTFFWNTSLSPELTRDLCCVNDFSLASFAHVSLVN
jgi:hypothetical protein